MFKPLTDFDLNDEMEMVSRGKNLSFLLQAKVNDILLKCLYSCATLCNHLKGH